MNRHRLGQSGEVKALGTGADSGAVHAADAPAPKRRLRWRSVLAGVVLIALGYAFAETALAFGWWGPVAEDLELTPEDRRYGATQMPPILQVGACDAAWDMTDPVIDHLEDLTDRLIVAVDEADISEIERMAVKRGAAYETFWTTFPALERICGPEGPGVGILIASWEDAAAGWESFCDSMGWYC